jgi:hypothetical protein
MDFIFSTVCYITAIFFVCWLRHTPSQPQVAPTATQAETHPNTPVIPDPWEAPATTSGRRWVSPQPQPIKPALALCPAKDVKPQTRLQQPEIDLNALDAVALRKLCSQYKIQWRDVRGKNRHATKAMMIFQLNQKAVA